MLRFRMVGRDCDVQPTEYRVWVVDGYPDYDADYYTGLKGGTNPLVDVVAYAVVDDGYVVDFNLPNPLSWKRTYKTLPEQICNSQFAVVDGYAYLFGGMATDKIYRASLNRPAEWEYTGYKLPNILYGSQLLITSTNMYLLGGHDGYSATDHIYYASTTDPLSWTDLGSLLPIPLYNSNLFICDGQMYMSGGDSVNTPVTTILTASTRFPTVWSIDANVLPYRMSGSTAGIVGRYVYLFGGLTDGYPCNKILRATTSPFSGWSEVGTLPAEVSFAQFLTIGLDGYLFAVDQERTRVFIDGYYIEVGSQTYETKIFVCSLFNPLSWTLMDQTIPAELYQTQFGIIADRIFMFGGNGNSAIFTIDQIRKFNYNTTYPWVYGVITRTLYQAASQIDLMSIIGFPFWKTNYYHS